MSLRWDGERSCIRRRGVREADAAGGRRARGLWRTYYATIFNPARLKVKAMQAEMPKKYWRNLPEAELIPELIASGREPGRSMVDASDQPTTPAARRRPGRAELRSCPDG